MSVDALEVQSVRVGEVETVAFDGTPILDSGESFTGTVTLGIVAAVGTPTAPTVDTGAVSTGALTILDRSVAAGKALTCKVDATSATAGEFELTFTVDTDAAVARTKKLTVRLEVVD